VEVAGELDWEEAEGVSALSPSFFFLPPVLAFFSTVSSVW
jgi:hypothetical protein